jgi:L-lactate dehydrogenase
MTRDPVCGMSVDESETDYHTTYSGEKYSFCTNRCKQSFEHDPERYLAHIKAEGSDLRKVVVIGAGQVGSTYAFTLMNSGIVNHIVLVDTNRSLAEGNVMDLRHSLPFVSPVQIDAGSYEDCRDADLVVVTAGASQKPGETRLDLVKKNAAIFGDIIPKIAAENPRIILIVTNPVDILTYVALKLSGYPMNRVFGSGTVLDTARFRSLLAKQCEVDSHNVHGFIIGEHGDSELPVWSRLTVGGVPFDNYCSFCGVACGSNDRDELFGKVKNAAYEIIEKKGYTSHAISHALVRITGAILRDEHSILTVSSLLDGQYGVKDVCLSVPAIISKTGIIRILDLQLNESEERMFRESAKTLSGILRELDIQ